MNAASTNAPPASRGWLDWLRRELAPLPDRKARTIIITCGAVLCVIISMTLQVPEVAVSAYMIFFISQKSKAVTTLVGVLAIIGLTIGIIVSLLLYKITYGHPELRVPLMAVMVFLGMYLSRTLVIGPLGFLLGFVIAVTQSVGELLPSPELLVRALLWIWVALAYAIGLTVILNVLFLPNPTGPSGHRPKPKGVFVPDAFTNPAYVRFALKVTLAAMACYLFYTGVDWFGIHTAFITCIFIALDSIGATLQKGTLRALGCIIGGLFALFTIVFLIPHMETIVSLAIVVACVSAIAAWLGTGSERISYAGLQMAFAFYYGLFPGFNGYAPSTDLADLRDRIAGILIGLTVTMLVFRYIWPVRAIDSLRVALARSLHGLAQFILIPKMGVSIEAEGKAIAGLRAKIAKDIEETLHSLELTTFEIQRDDSSLSPSKLQAMAEHTQKAYLICSELLSEPELAEWQRMDRTTQEAEMALRTSVAKILESDASFLEGGQRPEADNLESAITNWNRLAIQSNRARLLRDLVEQVHQAPCKMDTSS